VAEFMCGWVGREGRVEGKITRRFGMEINLFETTLWKNVGKSDFSRPWFPAGPGFRKPR
jgi:hypothetical protein